MSRCNRAILSMDPGKATGFAMCMWENDSNMEVWSWETYSHMDACNAMTRFSALDILPIRSEATGVTYRPDDLIWLSEDFRISMGTAKKTQARWSLELIGVMRYFAGRSDQTFVLQTPAQAKTLVSDDRLKRLSELFPGFWHHTEGGHANDALRHLTTYLIRNRMFSDEIMQRMVTR